MSVITKRRIYDLIDEAILEVRANMRKKRENIDIEWNRNITSDNVAINITIYQNNQKKSIIKTITIVIYSTEYYYIFHYITCYLAELLSI